MLGFYSCLLLVYTVLLILAVIAWKNDTKEIQILNNSDQLSVIIAFRDEEKNLKSTITSIVSQKFEGDFEIILVNDHSTDRSLEIATEFELLHHNIKVYSLTTETGKKAAIKLAIEHSKGALIIQTDADCIVTDKWLSTMLNHFTDDCRLLLGPVAVTHNTKSWNWLNQIEMMCLQVVTCSSIYYNYPATANGANIMYRKEDYFDYQNSRIGSNYQSGDDQHLLDYIVTQNKSSIKYLKESNAIVSTHFPHVWEEMIEQRSRWASKNKDNKGAPFYVGILFLSLQLAVPSLIALSVINNEIWNYTWNYIFSKVIIEFILVYFVNQFFKSNSLKYSPLFSVVYPFFILFVLIKSQKKTNWKGREI